MSTGEVVIVSGCRTPIGSFGGAFKDVSAVELGTIAVREAVRRAGVRQIGRASCRERVSSVV